MQQLAQGGAKGMSQASTCHPRLRWWVPLPLACALFVVVASADERWVDVRSAHFRVLTDAGEKEGRKVATGFEQMRKLVQTLGGEMVVDPAPPIVIVAVRDQAGLRQLLPMYWERRGGLRPGGVFLGDTDKNHIAVRLDVNPDYRDDIVYHEYVHLLVRLNFSSLPVWLNEGLAEFYAGTTVRDDDVVFGLVNGNRLALLRERGPMPLAELFAIDGGSRQYNEQNRAGILYAESALLTHYFLIGDKGAHRQMLTDYLRLVSEGVPDPQAQPQAFGDLKALEKSFFRYVHNDRFLALNSTLDVPSSSGIVRQMSEAEILALRGEFLARYGRADKGRPVLEKARKADPNLAAVAQALGLLEWREGRAEEARRQLGDAIKLAPDDFASHYLWAQAMPKDAPDLPASEAAARRAIELNPSFAPAHALLSSVLRSEGKLEAALGELHEACQLEPTHGAYWVQRADLLREMKHLDIAEKIETQLARLAPSDPTQLDALAGYYREHKRLDDLERLLRKAAELNPGNALSSMMLGKHLQEVGRADDAEAAYRRALAVQPDNPLTLNAVAYLNADRNVKLPESLEC